MVDINVTNLITIGIISVASYALIKAGLKMAGVDVSWL